jgi:hypothetical protein
MQARSIRPRPPRLPRHHNFEITLKYRNDRTGPRFFLQAMMAKSLLEKSNV